MATGDSYPRGNEPMRTGAMSGASTPTTGATGASTAGSSYGGGMHSDTSPVNRASDDSALDNPKQAVGQVADQAQQKLMEVAGTAQEQAKTQIGGQLNQVGEALESVADAMTSVGKQLREKDQDHLAGLADQAAQRVDQFSGYVKGRDVDQLIGDVEHFARRQPMVFLGGTFLLGLMAARFLKSSRPEPEMRYRPNMGPGMSPGMRPSYGARPYASGGYGYAGGMSSGGPTRRASEYPNAGYANGGTSGMNAARRPSTGTMNAGMGSTPGAMRTASSAPAPSGSPAHVAGSGSMAGSPRPASSGTGTSAGWGTTGASSAPSTGSSGTSSAGST